MLKSLTSNRAARAFAGAAILLVAACNSAPPTGTPTPTPQPTPSPSPSPTPSASPSPTAGAISHPTDPQAVVLRMETGGGFVPMEFFLTQAPEFTLYGDGTVIYRQTDTRANDPIGGQGMLPFLVGRLDEDGVQALLRFALGQGHLLNAKADYNIANVMDAGTTVFTLNAADLSKTVSVYALGMDDPNNPADAADRKAFADLSTQLMSFEQRGKDGQLGDIKPYDPAFYRVYLLDSNGAAPPPQAVVDWPWSDLTVADFKIVGDDNRPRANLDRDHVSKLETVPTGGRAGLFVKSTGVVTLFSVGIRPLFPDDLAAAGLG